MDCRLVWANRWPIDDRTKTRKTVHRLLSIGSGTSNRRHARFLSDHPQFQSFQRKEYTPLHACTPITHMPVITFAWHSVYARRPGRGCTEYKCIIILQQLMLMLLAISLFAKVQLLFPEFFCGGTTTFRFLKSIDWPMEQTFSLLNNKFLWMGH